MGDTANGSELTRVKSYQWPAGHVAHLTEGQRDALQRFKTLCEEKGYYTPGDGDKTPASHDEETLLRYLRARKFLPQEAFGQFKDTEDWRKENQLDKLYETIDVEEYDASRRLYPQWTGRRDRRGIPLYVYEINEVSAKDVTAYTNSKDRQKQSTNSKVPWKMLKLFALYENLCRFVLPLCSAMPDRQSPETPVSQSNNIVDLGGVGFTKLWNLRNHMSDASKLATAHYPETLDRIFIVGAPSFFPTIWGWAQRWFDPITVSKIFVLTPKDMKSTLEKYVDLENIPTKYGGTLDWKFGDMPFLEPGIAKNLRWKEVYEEKGHKTLPKGPIKWQYDEDGDLVATAVGSENSQARSNVIAALHPETGIARLALSPGRASNTHIFHSTAAKIPPTDSTPLVVAGEKTVTKDATTPATADKMAAPPTEAVPTNPPSTGAVDTYNVPYTDPSNAISSPPADARQGTSTTRFDQQTGTHAEGQLASGTPDIRNEGPGDRTSVMDPATVGQAPKDHPGPEEPAPTMIEQAQHLAEQAVQSASQAGQTVLNAVGLGGKGAENEVEKKEITRDPEVEKMSGENVEEFLRSQMATRNQIGKE